jgi:hypothetical protein
MNPVPPGVPTLTEVIEMTLDDRPGRMQVPMAPESVALEDMEPAPSIDGEHQQNALVDAVMARLQPRLESWIEAHLAASFAGVMRGMIDNAASVLARDLRGDLPALLREALEDARHDPPAR